METFELFLKEKTYLSNSQPNTLRAYRKAFEKFKTYGGNLDKPSLTQFVVGMRESRLSPSACNVHIRGINSYLSWCHENGYTPEHLKIKKLKCEQKIIPIFTEPHIKTLLKHRPKGKCEHRLYALCCLLIDTGARIDEGLGVKMSDLNLDQLLVTFSGKGGKERVVPISLEMRKILWAYLKQRFPSLYLFPTRDGTRLSYRNTLRDMKNLCADLGIKGVRISPHGFRHYFAVNYLRQGGDLYRLSRSHPETLLRATKAQAR